MLTPDLLHNKKSPQGLTLVETVVATAILLTAAIVALALSVSNARGQRESEFQITANNLAREAIEVVRAQRDNNLLLGIDWDSGLANGTYIVEFDPAQNSWNLSSSFTDSKLYRTLGVFSHNSSGVPTAFSRTISIDSICQLADGSEAVRICAGSEAKIGISLSANVSWDEPGQGSRSVVIVNNLYAWK